MTVDVSGITHTRSGTPTGTVTTTWVGGFGPGFEICTVEAQCKAGVGGPGNPGQFASDHPTAIAVDSAGHVYAADGANTRVEKFGPTGSYLSSFAPGGTNPSAANGYNLAVDGATDHVLVGSNFTSPTERRIEEFDSNAVLQDTHLANSAIGDIGGIGVNPSNGNLYATQVTDDHRVVVVGQTSPPEAAISPATDIGATTATFNGTVTPPGGGLIARYRFEYSANGADWGRFPGADVEVGSVPVPVAVHQDAIGLDPNTHYEVRLVASAGSAAASIDTSSTVGFTTDPAPPLIVEANADDVERTTGSLQAKIDARHMATAYHFEWGQTDSYGQRTPDVDATISASGGAQAVERPISGLQPDTTYHFRVVASNAAGPAEGPDRVLRTLGDAGLPDNRAYELVSPSDRGPVARADDGSAAEIQLQAASDGQSLVWPLASGLLDSTARDAGGWTSSGQLTAGEYRYFSRDLSCGVLESSDPLAPDAPTGVTGAGRNNLFRRDAGGSYTVLSNLEPTNADAVGLVDQYSSVSASSDCGQVVFKTAFTYPAVGASGLYEWDHGAMRNVGVLPDGGVATGAVLGAAGGQNALNAVSDTGSRIFFSATSNDGNDAGRKALFVRKDGTSTVKVSASKTDTIDRGAVYQLASEAGSRVLFLANYGLTSSTSAGPTGGNCSISSSSCDLYEYDVVTGDLTDLSVDTADAGGAMVAGVLGASDDASHVYFAARGQLIAGKGRSVAANLSSGSYNVYLAHGGQRSYVGLLRAAEVNASGKHNGALIARGTAPFSPWASRVTPDGRHLLFPSSANVTGYDSGGVVEAYLYSADSDATVCISCRRDGQPSVGVPAGGDTATVPLASDGSVGHRNPSSPPRSLSADGKRVFFEKPDVLADGAVSGRDNVYQWESGQISLLAAGSPAGATFRTRFEDASGSGDDVFVSTLDALLPRDVDGTLDIYGVRVNGGLPWTPPYAPSLDIVNMPPPFQPVAAPRAAFSVKGLSRTQRARLVAGKRVRLSVKVSRAGKVSVKGVAKIKGVRTTVLTGVRRAKRAGTVKVSITLSKPARKRLAKAGSLKVKLTVTFAGARKVVRSVTLG
jgi:hypothetical protein